MDKETVTNLMDEAENRCRQLFDQLTTLQNQAQQIEVELERTRGDFRTYKKIADEWTDPKATLPEEDQHLPAYPGRQESNIPVPTPKKSPRKD